MAPHRFWRLLHQPQEWVGYHEIELRVGGIDQTGAGIATASSQFSSTYSAIRAVDNNDTTWWSTAQNPGVSWWQYDFGAGNEREIEEVAFWADNAVRIPLNFTIQSSDNGTDWTDWMVATVATPAANTWFTFSPEDLEIPPPPVGEGTPYRFWRLLNFQNNHSGRVGLSRIQMRAVIGGPDLALGKPATASGSYPTDPPSNAVTVGGANWHVPTDNSLGFGHWLQVDLGEPVAISEVVVHPSTWAPNTTPANFVIQGADSADSDDWHTEFFCFGGGGTQYTPFHWQSGVAQSFIRHDLVPPAPARFWRLWVESTVTPNEASGGREW